MRPKLQTPVPLAVLLLVLALPGGPGALGAQDPAPTPSLPEGVAHRAVDVWSDGTRLSGDLFHPQAKSPDSALPAIVLAHGWGGTRSHLNLAYAPFFAEAGFVVLTIDYRGWGDSDSRLVLVGDQPEPDADGEVTVRAKAVREIVDPFDQTEDIMSAVAWLRGEPGVDPDRIGLWGTSYSGGHVVWVAAHDPRIRATVSQVGAMDSYDNHPEGRDAALALGSRRARGEIAPFPDAEPVEGLTGTPNFARMAHYSPRDVAHRSRAAALIIDAGNEELFDTREHGRAVAAILAHRVPTRYVEIEGIAHYDIYRQSREQALELAIDWFREHL